MGLDRLTAAALVLLAAGCGRSHLPQRLIDGQRAQQFSPVHGSVIAMSRVLRGTMLGTRFSLCRPAALAGDPLVVERIGVVGIRFLSRLQPDLLMALERFSCGCGGIAAVVEVVEALGGGEAVEGLAEESP